MTDLISAGPTPRTNVAAAQAQPRMFHKASLRGGEMLIWALISFSMCQLLSTSGAGGGSASPMEEPILVALPCAMAIAAGLRFGSAVPALGMLLIANFAAAPGVLQIAPFVAHGMAILRLIGRTVMRRPTTGLGWRLGSLPSIGILAALLLLTQALLLSHEVDTLTLWRLVAVAGLTVSLPYLVQTDRDIAATRMVCVALIAGMASSFCLGVGSTLGTTIGPNSWADGATLDGWRNRNSIALIVVWGIFSLSAPSSTASFGRSVRAVWSVIMLLALALTFSRSGYLAFLVGLLVMVRRTRRIPWWLLCVAPFAIAIPANAVLERIAYTTAGSGRLDPSSSMRITLWRTGLDLIMNHPVTGVGIFRLHDIVEQAGIPGGFVYLHNTYLTLLAGFGPLACALAVCAALVYARHSRPADPLPPGRSESMAALAVASFFGEPLLTPAVLSVGIILLWNARESHVEAA